MWKLVILLTLYSIATAEARFPRGTATSQINYNIVTDGGATCDGVTDTAPAFKAFNTWALANQGSANQVVLTIPSGSTCYFGSSQYYPLVDLNNAFAGGINDLIVNGGSGATITSVGGSGFFLGTRGQCQAGLTSGSGCSARIQSASAGATQITLTAASLAAGYISRFSVGKWIMVGGLDVQGLFDVGYGFPVNNTYFEWRKVINADAGTGVITLDRALSNSYLSTWPNYNSGNCCEADAGGAATIWAMHDTWNTRQDYRNLTFSQSGQINSGGRNMIYRNVTFTGGGGNCGAVPSQNENFSAYNTSWSGCVIEVDKLVGLITMDAVTISQIDWQSNSIERLVMSNSTITTMFGAARDSQITDTSFTNFTPGSYNYGNSYKLVCTRCNVTTYGVFPSGGNFANISPTSYSMSGGVITWPVDLAGIAAQAFSSPISVPIFFTTANFSSVGMFNVTGISGGTWPAADNQTSTPTVTISSGSPNLNVSPGIFTSGDVGKTIIIADAGLPTACGGGPCPHRTHIQSFTNSQNVVLYENAQNTVSGAAKQVQWGTANVSVQTNTAGGFPTLTNLGGSYIRFRSSQAPQFTCDACTGDPVFTAYNIQNGATPLAPIGVFAKRTYTTQAAATNVGSLEVQGKLSSLTIAVTQAYTGSGAGTLIPTGQFGLGTVKQSDWSVYNWSPNINVKVPGTRVITPSGVTCDGSAGGCSGDTNLTVPEAVWISDGINPNLTLAGSGGVNPTFSITIQTDQSP